LFQHGRGLRLPPRITNGNHTINLNTPDRAIHISSPGGRGGRVSAMSNEETELATRNRVAAEEFKKSKNKAFVKAFAEVMESAEPYANAKEKITEIDIEIAENQRKIGYIEGQIVILKAQREQKEKEIREIIRERERQKALKIDEIVNNVEEKPYKSEQVDSYTRAQAEKQE